MPEFDLGESFFEGGAGYAIRRIVDIRRKPLLTTAMWRAGLTSFELICQRAEIHSGDDLAELWASAHSFAGSAGQFLDEAFFPDFIELVRSNHIVLQSDAEVTADDFQKLWFEYDFPEKLLIYITVLKVYPFALRGNDGFREDIRLTGR